MTAPELPRSFDHLIAQARRIEHRHRDDLSDLETADLIDDLCFHLAAVYSYARTASRERERAETTLQEQNASNDYDSILKTAHADYDALAHENRTLRELVHNAKGRARATHIRCTNIGLHQTLITEMCKKTVEEIEKATS